MPPLFVGSHSETKIKGQSKVKLLSAPLRHPAHWVWSCRSVIFHPLLTVKFAFVRRPVMFLISNPARQLYVNFNENYDLSNPRHAEGFNRIERIW